MEAFEGSFGGKPVKVFGCGFHLFYMAKIINRTISQDTNIAGVKHNHAAMTQYLDVQRSCDNKSVLEDANVNVKRGCDNTLSTSCEDSLIGTITKNIDYNVGDAHDDEDDYMGKWLELLCKFFQWI